MSFGLCPTVRANHYMLLMYSGCRKKTIFGLEKKYYFKKNHKYDANEKTGNFCCHGIAMG